ncbi:MAG: copper transporter [Armatimonadetes bacterium]|nr:copper transporter [Armatimonadota bacterium]
MLIDLKYHLISLVAVFLALAVGILVGSSFVAGTSVKGLEKEFVKLRIQNQQQQNDLELMRDQVASYEEFGRTVAPILVDGKLAMRRIALIQTGDYSEAAQSAKSILGTICSRPPGTTTARRFGSCSSAGEEYARVCSLRMRTSF